MMPPRALLLLLGAWFSSACSTVHVEPQRARQVRSLAVVGFEVQTQAFRQGVGGSGNNPVAKKQNAIRAMKDTFSGERAQAQQSQAEGAYAALTKRLSQAMGWRVLDAQALLNNPSYRAEYDKRTAPYLSWAMRYSGVLHVEGIVMNQHARWMKQPDRVAMIDALGVDAVAVVKVTLQVGDTKGFSTGGFGYSTYLPKAIMDIVVYDRSSDEPIWKDWWAEGAPASIGQTKKMGVVQQADLVSAFAEATELGVDALVARYGKASAEADPSPR